MTQNINLNITLNGQKIKLNSQLNVLELIDFAKFNANQVVVMINQHVLNKNNWGKIHLKENDIVEVLKFVGGG